MDERNNVTTVRRSFTLLTLIMLKSVHISDWNDQRLVWWESPVLSYWLLIKTQPHPLGLSFFFSSLIFHTFPDVFSSACFFADSFFLRHHKHFFSLFHNDTITLMMCPLPSAEHSLLTQLCLRCKVTAHHHHPDGVWRCRGTGDVSQQSIIRASLHPADPRPQPCCSAESSSPETGITAGTITRRVEEKPYSPPPK